MDGANIYPPVFAAFVLYRLIAADMRGSQGLPNARLHNFSLACAKYEDLPSHRNTVLLIVLVASSQLLNEPSMKWKGGTIMGYNYDDPSLKTAADGLTVWTLHDMAQGKQFKELNDLFNNGLTMNSLPVGLAAGAAARVFDIDKKGILGALNFFPREKLWGEGIFSF